VGWTADWKAVRSFVAAHVLDAPFFGDEEAGTDIQPAITNFKSALQELAQAHKLPQPPLHHCAGTQWPGALQDVHGRGADCGKDLGRQADRPHQRRSPRRGRAREFTSGCGKEGVPGFDAASRTPTMEPARKHERLP